MALITDFDKRYRLGVNAMDETHCEFIVLVNALETARGDEFRTLFAQLLEHTRAHFAAEEYLMEQHAFPATREHKDEHQRILGDMARFHARVDAGPIAFGRAYVCEQLPQWFDLHAVTMDSALAAHLKSCSGL